VATRLKRLFGKAKTRLKTSYDYVEDSENTIVIRLKDGKTIRAKQIVNATETDITVIDASGKLKTIPKNMIARW
jgi:S1-C subfamily serine protease